LPGVDIRTAVGLSRRAEIGDWALRLVQSASPNPPGDTRAVAEAAAAIIRAAVPGAEVHVHAASADVHNVVARLRGSGAGRRIILNGHLDTYPLELMRSLTGLHIVAADFNTVSPPHDMQGMAASLCAHMMMEAMVLLARQFGKLE